MNPQANASERSESKGSTEPLSGAATDQSENFNGSVEGIEVNILFFFFFCGIFLYKTYLLHRMTYQACKPAATVSEKRLIYTRYAD